MSTALVPEARATTAAALPTFNNAQAWDARAMASSSEWIHHFSADELADIEAAILHAKARGASLVHMTTADFPLPRLAPVLARLHDEVHSGRGFVLLRGFEAQRHTVEEAAIAFRGIGAYFGQAVSQNGKGHVLGHVKDLGLDYAAPTTRGYQTTAELKFHTDGGDSVALLCLRPARSGGKSRIASSTTVWNEIVRRRPDLAQVLQQPYYLSRWGEVGPGEKPWVASPLFTPWGGRMIAWFVASAINKGQDLPGVPKLTAQQREAMEWVNAIADEEGIRLDMEFRVGDMQIVSNHSIMHSRTEYEDWDRFEDKRHLLRLWLSSDRGPALPPHSTQAFQGPTASGRPNGINVPGVPLVAPLDAC